MATPRFTATALRTQRFPHVMGKGRSAAVLGVRCAVAVEKTLAIENPVDEEPALGGPVPAILLLSLGHCPVGAGRGRG